VLSKNPFFCPVCNSNIFPKGPIYSTKDLFNLWSPIRFSPETIEAHLAQSKSTQLYSCPNCGLDIFLPQIIGTPKFYIEAYHLALSDVDKERTFTYSDTKWEDTEVLKDVMDCTSILEVGCGNGELLRKMQSLFFNTTGIEYNEKAVESAREKGLQVFYVDEIDTLPHESYDVVISFHVLEHVANPIEFVRQLSNFLKPGGKLILSVPNQDGPVKYIDPCIHNMPPHHATRWRLKTFEKLAEKTNLKIIRVSYEPLLMSNYSYYSYHWVDYYFKQRKNFPPFARRGLSMILGSIFRLFYVSGLRYCSLLTGMCIYIVLEKKKMEVEA
jgi:SAM-dependent methyltransferase